MLHTELVRWTRAAGMAAISCLLMAACAPGGSNRPEPMDEEEDEGRSGGRGGGGRADASAGGRGGGASGGSGGGGGTSTPDAAPVRDASRGPDDAGNAGRGDAEGEKDAGAGDGGPTGFMAVFQVECVKCHGPTGEGTAKGPDIVHPVRDHSTWVVRNGRTHPGYMEPMPKFTTAQISNTVLNQLLDFLSAPPKPTTGAGLFKDFCANCHGNDGKGGVTMRNITIPPENTLARFVTNVRGGHHPGEFANRREFMPKWSAAQLSDAEIRLIFDHVINGK